MQPPRVFRIAIEPDDAQSLVRFLIWGNDFDIKGPVACPSVHPEEMEEKNHPRLCICRLEPEPPRPPEK
ncbi:hypothetical protein P175DRAFT_0126892 [Aspergillus ochraceoroseus IBT 24754]|uniref:Cellulose-binding Sde182 nucleoside hydrolase-like domain-containing protein n=1 Tax=Aspergillus ochraceoroseus IBT 24754 TaxID=1392256 RepID=A0A2T5M156_9EURO|nr:uncharacterized protein P175DRAFT_0126892 [Aspergillus ochraceoroseus IBT 24754]PTU22260.1 hypothetical protein P175DRAFT_0126892 [Aspergillus ochraceoroseus IBT 24754]